MSWSFEINDINNAWSRDLAVRKYREHRNMDRFFRAASK